MASRPGSGLIITVAVFHFIAGGLGLLMSLCRGINVFALMQFGQIVPKDDPAFIDVYLANNVPGFVAVHIAYTGIGLVFDILLIVCGIGLLTRKPWSRYLTIGYGVASLLVKLVLRGSIANGWRKAYSSLVAMPGMSPNSRMLASIRIAWLCGCGALATAVTASRLSENACDTACACGVPKAAP